MAMSRSLQAWLFASLLGAAVATVIAAAGPGRTLPDPVDTPVTAGSALANATTSGVARSGDRLVAVGPRGLIRLSTDGARSWKQVASPVATDLVAVRFTPDGAVWAVGHDGVALRSRDGGLSWQRMLDGRSLLKLLRTTYDVRAQAGEASAAAVQKEIARAIGQSATPDLMPSPFLDVWFADANEGFLIGAFGLLLRTRDGGQSWEPLIERSDNDRRFHLYAMDGQGERRFIAGEQGLVMRWDAATGRFAKLESPYIGSYFGIDVQGRRVVVYGLRGNAFVSQDEGASWQKITTGVDSNLVALVRLSGDRFVLVSQAGNLLAVTPDSLKATELQSPLTSEVFGAAEGRKGSLVLAQINGLRDVELLGIAVP